MTSPSPAAPAAPIRLCATHGCGHRHGAHYSDDGSSGCEECECGGFQAAPPPPPVEGPGLAQAARALLATVTKGDGGECWENSDERGTLHSVGYIPIPANDCPACAVRAALAAEEERERLRREAAEAILVDAETVFGTEKAQAAVMQWARAELGSAP